MAAESTSGFQKDPKEGPGVVEADNIFVLMKRKYRISRNVRAQWYFQHINQTISIEDSIENVHIFTQKFVFD